MAACYVFLFRNDWFTLITNSAWSIPWCLCGPQHPVGADRLVTYPDLQPCHTFLYSPSMKRGGTVNWYKPIWGSIAFWLARSIVCCTAWKSLLEWNGMEFWDHYSVRWLIITAEKLTYFLPKKIGFPLWSPLNAILISTWRRANCARLKELNQSRYDWSNGPKWIKITSNLSIRLFHESCHLVCPSKLLLT